MHRLRRRLLLFARGSRLLRRRCRVVMMVVSMVVVSMMVMSFERFFLCFLITHSPRVAGKVETEADFLSVVLNQMVRMFVPRIAHRTLQLLDARQISRRKVLSKRLLENKVRVQLVR